MERRHDLDWLRVIVFCLLILYHVGMFFVPWGWHIKNDVIYPWLRYPMLFLSQWRLHILFVISGMGTYYALSRRTGRQFAVERLRRLFVPLILGILIIVPPQIYFERLDKAQYSGNYFSFWWNDAFTHGIYPKGNISYHHLWFVAYLLIYSLVLTPLFVYWRKNPDAWPLRFVRNIARTRFGLFWLVIPLYIWESLLEPFFPVTNAFWGDWFWVTNMVTHFLYGYLLISSGNAFWETVKRHRRTYVLLGILAFCANLIFWFAVEDSTPVHFTEAFFKVFNTWSWILAIFGYAANYLNQPSPFLRYANEAVYPFYILHQTIIIAIGYYLMHVKIGLLPKYFLMAAGTFLTAWLLYEFLVRRFRWLRVLFGMKMLTKE
jgi:glucans biosynthesis protein C